ncbi:MAG: acyltransferase [Desulfovibrio sp.]|nr:acyltransferase [Desulfovibrio sp.]
MRTNHIALLKTICLAGVIFLHAALPFTAPGRFWRFYAERQSAFAEELCFWGGLIIIPSFMLASGYLAALSGNRQSRSVIGQIVNRAKRLLVPWFFLTVFWMVPLYTFFDLPAFNRPEGFTLVRTYRVGLSGLFTDHLWFLLTLFWVSCFWAIIQPLAKRFSVLSGLAFAIAAALLMNDYGRGLTWYAVWETDGPLVWFVLGCVLFRYRERMERSAARRPLTLFAVNAALFVVLARNGVQTPLLHWITCALGALAAFQICLHLARHYKTFRDIRLYSYFEDNAFRFYLFHVPGAYLTFKILFTMGMTSPLPFILLSFALNFCLTAGIVAVVNALEKRLIHA